MAASPPSPPTRPTTGSNRNPPRSGSGNGSSTTGGPPASAADAVSWSPPRHADVEDLNRRARRRLAEASVLGDEVRIGERRFAVGDDILATRNDDRIMIFNGTRATITGIDVGARRIDAVDPSGRPMTIPYAYAEAGHLTWGYATTLHKAQGTTVDQAFLLVDDTLRRERSYSGLSRGVEANDVYRAVPDVEEHHGVPEVDDLIERLRQTVWRFLTCRP